MLKKIVVNSSLSENERFAAFREERLCQKCFQTFKSKTEKRFHQGHSCWFAPYSIYLCPNTKDNSACKCAKFFCNVQNCNLRFVTQFELDYHLKYDCVNVDTCGLRHPFLTDQELKEKKFNCYKCFAKYSTKLELDNCECDSENQYFKWLYPSHRKKIDFTAIFNCLLCNTKFENHLELIEHECE